MDGENDGTGIQAQGAGQQAAQGDQAAQQQTSQQQATLTGKSKADDERGDALEQARKGYEAALAERDAKIAELEG